ncbi:MAG: non-ribosomal peptide synthetase, partial [Actinomycetota bacterium]|nr:non-ribosomal peptide synthetase [Actinomycetota bacterium]
MTPARVREGGAPVTTFADELGGRGIRPALIDGDRVVTYAELDERVADEANRLGPVRRLVLLEISPDLPSIVTYLAALQGRHPVLLAPPTGDDRFGGLLRSTYDPDVVVVGGELTERRRGSVHELHPDLALLLSTSGSTGSPKLVRLSHANVQANATAIVTALDIDEHDRAITSLPLAYCYGLSILHSHLTSGASVVLTDRSVVDPVFWEEFRRHGVTSLAGVPYTFELLDRSGFEHLDVPTLRRVTQAGGRLDPIVVDRYARLGRRRSWDLHVMYGQTEATARMACLPPELAVDHPEAIGRPVAGGEFHLEDVDGEVGELVYRGPNVMLGYAEVSADLAKGREVEELHTGDLARLNDAGLYEVVGRRHRFVKPFGLRVDLDAVERRLGIEGVEAMCTGDDRRLVVTTTGAPSVGRVRDLVERFTTVPRAAVSVRRVDRLPRLLNGKPDYAALAPGTDDAETLPPTSGLDGVRRIFGRVLAASPSDIASDASFVDLGGDSLSYVEASVRLEELLGTLPHDWTSQSVAELATLRPEA